MSTVRGRVRVGVALFLLLSLLIAARIDPRGAVAPAWAQDIGWMPLEEAIGEPTDEPVDDWTTEEPVETPTEIPTELPTETPTPLPTEELTPEPTAEPTDQPSETPIGDEPTATVEPTGSPTEAPVDDGDASPEPVTEVPTETVEPVETSTPIILTPEPTATPDVLTPAPILTPEPTATLTATPQTDEPTPTGSPTEALPARTPEIGDIEIRVTSQNGSVRPGGTAVYAFSVTNTGETAARFVLAGWTEGDGWTTNVCPETSRCLDRVDLELAPGETTTVTVIVIAAPDAVAGQEVTTHLDVERIGPATDPEPPAATTGVPSDSISESDPGPAVDIASDPVSAADAAPEASA